MKSSILGVLLLLALGVPLFHVLPWPPTPGASALCAREPASTSGYVIYPVKTALQRELLPAQTTLFVLVDTTEALKGDNISVEGLNLKELRKDLLK